jgi:IS30 family transposase
MAQKKAARTCLSLDQQAQLWRQWVSGEPIEVIAAALDRPPGTVYVHIHSRGGWAPPPRRRRCDQLNLNEREQIFCGLRAGRSQRQIARELGRSPSTISREVTGNGGCAAYRAGEADRRAWRAARRPKSCKLFSHPALFEYVRSKLDLQWSPQQIDKDLAVNFKADKSMRVSHETLYKTLFVQARGELKRELTAQLRTQRRGRKPRARGLARQGQILGAISIRERPAEVEDRAVPGHWEGDLLCGSKSTQIATLVERFSRFVLLVKLPTRDSLSVVDALSHAMRRLPLHLRRSLTWDRGTEMAEHARFTVASDMPVYFCDPRSPWQRGSNENTNGLLRQYFPKGTDLSVHSQQYLDEIAHRLNTRPRMTLDWRNPAVTLNDTVATTG